MHVAWGIRLCYPSGTEVTPMAGTVPIKRACGMHDATSNGQFDTAHRVCIRMGPGRGDQVKDTQCKP